MLAKNLILCSIIAFVILVRLLSVSLPFYTIEDSVCSLAGNSITGGGVPYRDIVDHRGPVTYFIYAAIFYFFGKSNVPAVHCALIFFIIGTMIVLYLLGKLAWGRKAGLWSALLFAVFSYTYGDSDMLIFHPEWAAIFFTVCASYLFLIYCRREARHLLFFSGMLFGLAFFSKQTTLLDLCAAMVFLCAAYFIKKKKALGVIAECAVLTAGFGSVILFFIFYFSTHNSLRDFYTYFWEYNVKYYIPAAPFSEKVMAALPLQGKFFYQNILLFVLFIAGAGVTIRRLFKNRLLIEAFELYAVIWGIFSYIGASCLGRGFGYNYITALPAFCLTAGIFMCVLSRYKARNLIIYIAVVTMFLQVGYYVNSRIIKRAYLHMAHNRRAGIKSELDNMISYIKQNSSAQDKIFVWGFYPQIYIMADRDPASRYIYSNFLTGFMPYAREPYASDSEKNIIHGTWDIFMHELKQNIPVYIVDTSVGNRMGYGMYPPERFRHLSGFLEDHYAMDKVFFDSRHKPLFRIFKRRI